MTNVFLLAHHSNMGSSKHYRLYGTARAQADGGPRAVHAVILSARDRLQMLLAWSTRARDRSFFEPNARKSQKCQACAWHTTIGIPPDEACRSHHAATSCAQPRAVVQPCRSAAALESLCLLLRVGAILRFDGVQHARRAHGVEAIGRLISRACLGGHLQVTVQNDSDHSY